MDFAERVRAFVRSVPPGRVTTYGDVALAVGCPGGARAVGRVMAATPSGTAPCHRVVRADGRVAACEGPGMASRLRKEGVTVRGGHVPGPSGTALAVGFADAAEPLFSPLPPRRPVATLSWWDVVIIGLVATVGFTLLSYGYSLWMAKRNVSYQVKPKPPKKEGKPKDEE